MPRHARSRSQCGAATAEYAIGVLAAVLLAALLAELVLNGIFNGLLRTLFGRTLAAVKSLFSAGSAAVSLTDLASSAWSSASVAASSTAGWAWGAVVDTASGALRWVAGPVSRAFS